MLGEYHVLGHAHPFAKELGVLCMATPDTVHHAVIQRKCIECISDSWLASEALNVILIIEITNHIGLSVEHLTTGVYVVVAVIVTFILLIVVVISESVDLSLVVWMCGCRLGWLF